jgi:aspartate aminotransferase-like enzyme
MYALEVQLDAIKREGMENRWRRHTAMAEMTNTWIEKCRQDGINLKNIVEAGRRSPTVSTIELPAGVNSEEFLRKVRSRGFTVATGYGKLKATTFRIGHMGDHSPATLDRCLAACRWAISN